jgi:serine/threonine protein kinase
MGEVFLAEHRLMRRLVALKTIRLGLADSTGITDRFLREIRATAKLTHPNVVVVHDAEATPDGLFLVMEYLDGRDLRFIVRESGALDPTTACIYVYQAALALHHAHGRGVIHRDIKPSNLFVVPDQSGAGPGLVKVLDFGLAKMLGETFPGVMGTPAGYAMGTRGFMPPEQSKDARAVGVHADIFSLGRTLYFLLSGRNPYRDGVHSLLAEESGVDPVTPLDEVRPGVPADVREVMLRMSARRSEDRFQSCEEVLAALSPLCEPGRVERRAGRKRWWQFWRRRRA